jgi:glycosyltransferase involved in cell wall biosynthesis
VLQSIVDPRVRIYRHEVNQGKGTGIRTALSHATGDVVIIQDADLEYDPQDYPRLLEPVAAGAAQVVYGARRGPRHSYLPYHLGGRLLSLLADLLYGQRLMDIHTGYKLFDSRLLTSLPLRCTGFEFCPEVTARIGKRGIQIHEMPIRYEPRTFAEGKKIRWVDGVVAAWTLLEYRFRD